FKFSTLCEKLENMPESSADYHEIEQLVQDLWKEFDLAKSTLLSPMPHDVQFGAKNDFAILIVEDEREIRESLRDILEIEGYRVFTAINGADGVAQVQKLKMPLIVLLDLMMPVMDGWDFMRAARDLRSSDTMKVILVTAFSEKAVNIKCQG